MPSSRMPTTSGTPAMSLPKLISASVLRAADCARVAVLQGRLRRVFALFGALQLHKQAPDRDRFRAKQQADTAFSTMLIAVLIEPDRRSRLRLILWSGQACCGRSPFR
jgi:hypothetical protein